MKKRLWTLIVLIMALTFSLLTVSCSEPPTVTAGNEASTVESEVSSNEHASSTNELIAMLEADDALKALMVKSIASAANVNPDPQTNPAQDLESFYDFMDWSVTCMPWNVLTDVEYPTLYEHIDQSINYFWFLLDQPLEELEGQGYYYPALQYHEPIAGWCKTYADAWGEFLSTEESWNDDYWQMAYTDERFRMNSGDYASENVWTSFNDFFARKLSDPSVRPIADSSVVSPADSMPQGVWKIDDSSHFVHKDGVPLKSAAFTSVNQLLGEGTAYADAFAGGTLTHTFLDVFDYHRYHFPISGKIVELRDIPGTNAVGGIPIWDAETERYVMESDIPGWQMIETRACVILETEDFGLVAVLPIGMSQICSCNWEDTVTLGATVEKGDPMGYFLFGGSDVVMLFQKGVELTMLAPEIDGGKYGHIQMGQPYASLTPIAE